MGTFGLQMRNGNWTTLGYFSLVGAVTSEKSGNPELQLEAARRRVSRSGLFLAKCVLHTCTNCYFSASDQNSNIAIRFSDLDFVNGTLREQ